MSTNKRVLFICNTAYQLMTCVQLRNTVYQSDMADLLLSNQMVNAATLVRKAQECGLFGHVEYIENKKQTFSSRVAETLFNFRAIRNMHDRLGDYDVVCLSNISVFSILFVCFYQRGALQVNIFEDGFVTYSNAFLHMDRASLIAKCLLPQGLLGRATHVFVFNPDLMEWHLPGITPVPIPKFNKKDARTLSALNSIFGVNELVDTYDKPYIFLEESFYADHFPVDDVRLVELLAQKAGRENVMVKLHPRNPENRFAPLGIKTNTNFSVPWELIVLNSELSDCTLVSISSSAILQPYLLLGVPIRAISLLKLLPTKPGNMQGELGGFMQSLFDKYSNICLSPTTEEEFLHSLDQ